MTRNRKFIVAGAALVAMGLAAAGAFAERGGSWEHHGWDHHGGLMGSMAFGAPMGGFCRGDGTEMADHFLVHIEHKVKPTDAQKASFEELKTATRAAAEKMKAGCPQVASANAPKDSPKPAQSLIERLDRAQARLEASLDAIKTVRPAAEKFYASLSDEQKSALVEHRGHGWRDRGDDAGPDATPPAQPQ
jgi:hypothetical protein